MIRFVSPVEHCYYSFYLIAVTHNAQLARPLIMPRYTTREFKGGGGILLSESRTEERRVLINSHSDNQT